MIKKLKFTNIYPGSIIYTVDILLNIKKIVMNWVVTIPVISSGNLRFMGLNLVSAKSEKVL